MFVKSNRIRDR